MGPNLGDLLWSEAPSTPRPPAPSLGHFLRDPGDTTSHFLHRLGHLLVEAGILVGLPLGGVVMVSAVGLVVWRRHHAKRVTAAARQVRILAPPQVDLAGAETLWANLVSLLRPGWRRATTGQPHVGFELVAGCSGLAISLWVPGEVPPGLVEQAVEAAWPGARTETLAARAPLPEGAACTGGRLRLAGPEHYPLRTEHRADPLRPLLGALAGLGPDDVACVQVLARPLAGRRRNQPLKAAAARSSGQPTSAVGKLVDLAAPGSNRHPAESDPRRRADVSAILDKASQPCWAVAVRYGVSSTEESPQTPKRLRGQAHAIASAFAMYSGRNRFDRKRLHHPARALSDRSLGRGDLLCLSELAALAHLPTDVSVSGLARAGAKAVAPPPEVSSVGKVLGDAQGGHRSPVALSVADSRYHLHVMGATGSGKSTLLTNLVVQDVEAGRGAVVIDPKGDLVTDILDRLPDGAENNTVLIDPDDTFDPPVLNPLDLSASPAAGPGEFSDIDLVVDNLVGIFRRIFESYWGPRTDDVLRSACLTLLRGAKRDEEAGPAVASLADVPRLLAEDDFRHAYTDALSDQAGLKGFWDWYEAMSEAQRSQVVGPVLNKLRAFLLRGFVRQLMGTPIPSFSMEEVLDGKLCLVRVPKGILGEETSRLLGSFVVAKVWQAATHRARVGQAARVDAALYVDECQNFLNLPRSFEEILAEARGYRLSLVLAHQHLGQLSGELRQAISANARTKVFFAMSPEDGRVLSRHVAPEVSEHDLCNLGSYQAAARLVVGGKQTHAFTLQARPAVQARAEIADKVRASASANFGSSAHNRRTKEARRSFAGRKPPGRGGRRPVVPPKPDVASGVASRVASGGASGVALRSDGGHCPESAGQAAETSSHGVPDSKEN